MGDVGRDAASADGSRQRKRPSATPLHLHSSDDAKQRVLELNEQEDAKDDKEKRTYGRTPDGQGKVPLELLAGGEELATRTDMQKSHSDSSFIALLPQPQLHAHSFQAHR
jgi:hypothetical protein